jgi:hypothetical protein
MMTKIGPELTLSVGATMGRIAAGFQGLCQALFAFVLLVVVLTAPLIWGQATVSTGNIQGTITDPSGAVVSGAKVVVTNTAAGRSIESKSTSAGTYSVGALLPGDYVVRVEAPGFQTTELSVTVQVGVTSSGNIRLTVGRQSQVVSVQGTQIQVNTEQSSVQGVLTTEQIENLPVNGRNFLDLAQLEPGVQIQDGGNFDPTKNGFSSISFGGRFGRTARIEVDGVDISDETVGTTTQNIPEGAIQEFNLSQSNLDLSSELTSSGAVNVVTRSGNNEWHGEAFYLFRDHSMDARLPGGVDAPFQRNQFGGRLGGPIVRNKLFFFLDAERTKQNQFADVISGEQFAPLSGGYNAPFRETEPMGRLDWQIKPDNYRVFYRFSFDQLEDVAGAIPNAFQPFANHNRTQVHAVGFDFNSGSFTHSIRFGYTKFINGIADATAGTSIFDPEPGLELAIGTDPSCLTPSADVFCSGPNFLAPQATIQSDHQIKYDGAKAIGSHLLRYGGGYNRINSYDFASFLGLAPEVSALATAGTSSNPLTYPVQTLTLGNGQGLESEVPSFGYAAGGYGPDNRIAFYVGDTWNAKPDFTVNYGLRYSRDTWRTNSDLPPIPCSELSPSLAAPLAAAGTPCTGYILDLYGAGLGNRVPQPNKEFAPQLGLAWAPHNSTKTVIRAGIGLYYENVIWNNSQMDRPARLQTGLFNNFASACASGEPQTLPFTTTLNLSNICNQPIGTVASQIVQLQQQYQAATLAAGPQSNGAFIGNTLNSDYNTTGTSLLAPDFKTPRSVQMNVGIQREIKKGMVLTADYLRNIETHTMLGVDVNHVGDARYFNLANAQAATATTLANCGAASITASYSANCPTDPANGTNDSGTWIPRPATISDYAGNGLDSGNVLCGGSPCPSAAFPGINPNLGSNQMMFPAGRSVYNGLDLSLKQDLTKPLPGIKRLNLEVSYSFSRYVSTATDSDYVSLATDNNHPTHYLGPNGLDRTHQLSLGGTMDLPAWFRASLVAHFDSPLPQTLFLPASGNAGGIFVTDVTGDGSGDGSGVYPFGDVLPGTNVGSFGRDVSAGHLNAVIQNYNNNDAGQPTPAGAQLINSGLFTLGQLQGLGAVQQPIALAPPGNVGLGWLKTMDLKVAWEYKIHDRLTVEPSLSLFNVLNFANFDGPNQRLGGTLDGGSCSVNGATYNSCTTNRLGLGTGTFALGAPRAVEWGLRITF